MTAEIIQFVPRSNPNRDVLDRIHGVPANVELPTTVDVGGNPNVQLSDKDEAWRMYLLDLWRKQAASDE